MERDGSLDSSEYIAQLPENSAVRARQNVFGFALGAASLGVNQFISMIVAGGGMGDVGALLYQLKLGQLDRERGHCFSHCPFQRAVARGDSAEGDFRPTGQHPVAQRARAARSLAASRWHVCVGRRADTIMEGSGALLDRLISRFSADS